MTESGNGDGLRNHDHPTTRRVRKKRWLSARLRWSIRLGVIAVTVGYLVTFGCDSQFYHPNQKLYYRAAEFQLAHEDVYFPTADGLTLHGWFLPARKETRGTVIHFHGNAANVTNHVALIAWLPHAGYNVLMFDYRGFGQSEGRPTRTGTINDGHAVVDYMKTRPEYDAKRLFAYGQSLGGAVAVVIGAERDEIRAVVAEAAFGDYRGIAAWHGRKLVYFDVLARGLARVLISDGHDPIDVVAKLAPRPLLVIAGGDDHICPAQLGRELFEAAREPKEYILVEEADHFEALDYGGGEVQRRIVDTFEQAAQMDGPG